MKLPDVIFRQEILQCLTLDNIVKLDNACMNHMYRSQLMDKIDGVILIGDKDRSVKASLFKWLGMRRIYLIKMNLLFEGDDDDDDDSHNLFVMENHYKDQFRYTQHIVMSGLIRDIISIFIVSHCPCLLSIDIFDCIRPDPIVTDYTLQSIAEHCTGLKSLSLNYCQLITDASIISMSTHCTGLQSLNLGWCRQITDASIISISTHCIGLQSLNLDRCRKITEASIISISTHCTGLQSLHLYSCKITDTSIISISSHCTRLQSLILDHCHRISDASILSISTYCNGLQSLYLGGCEEISDASIIPISENCTGLKELYVSYASITDASLIAIAKNCTGLQLLRTYDCDRLSCNVLRGYFDSLSKLRAVLLSIHPSLSI